MKAISRQIIVRLVALIAFYARVRQSIKLRAEVNNFLPAAVYARGRQLTLVEDRTNEKLTRFYLRLDDGIMFEITPEDNREIGPQSPCKARLHPSFGWEQQNAFQRYLARTTGDANQRIEQCVRYVDVAKLFDAPDTAKEEEEAYQATFHPYSFIRRELRKNPRQLTNEDVSTLWERTHKSVHNKLADALIAYRPDLKQMVEHCLMSDGDSIEV